MNSYIRQQGQSCGMRNNRFSQDANGPEMGREYSADCAVQREGNEFPLAMAYVPWQTWRDVTDGRRGLAQGSIFNELVLNFECANKCCNK